MTIVIRLLLEILYSRRPFARDHSLGDHNRESKELVIVPSASIVLAPGAESVSNSHHFREAQRTDCLTRPNQRISFSLNEQDYWKMTAYCLPKRKDQSNLSTFILVFGDY